MYKLTSSDLLLPYIDLLESKDKNVDNIKMKIPNIEIIEFLGEGSFGVAFKIKYYDDDTLYAMKIMKKCLQNLHEVNIVSKIKDHCSENNVLCFRDVKFIDDNIYLFTEYVEARELFDILVDGSLALLPLDILYDIMLQIALAVKYLHDNNIVHLDIKLENILYVDEAKPKIILIDYGFACITTHDVNLKECNTIDSNKGSIEYTSPEICLTKPTHIKYITNFFKSDIYSLGCVFYIMLKQDYPTNVKDMRQYYNGTKEPPYVKNIADMSCDYNLKILIFDMLKMNYVERCDINYVVDVLSRLVV